MRVSLVMASSFVDLPDRFAVFQAVFVTSDRRYRLLCMQLCRICSLAFGALAIAAVMIFSMSLGHAGVTAPNFAGHYELANSKAGRAFSLEVKMTDPRHAEISFSAAMDDGSGPAPDGDGKGRIEEGVLSCKFTDSFSNEGTCTLTPAKHGYEFNMVVVKVVDPRPFHFYGSVLLKKSTKP